MSLVRVSVLQRHNAGPNTLQQHQQQHTIIHTHTHHTHRHQQQTDFLQTCAQGLRPWTPLGLRPRPHILALRARFLNKMKKIKLPKIPHFRHCAVTLRHNFQKFQTPTPQSSRLGYPIMPKKRSPPTALGPPAHGAKKNLGGKMPPRWKFWGWGPPWPPPGSRNVLSSYRPIADCREHADIAVSKMTFFRV